MWQKEVPSKTGFYWTSTKKGVVNRPLFVSYDGNGKLVYAGGLVHRWHGWWWSEPLVKPVAPTEGWDMK